LIGSPSELLSGSGLASGAAPSPGSSSDLATKATKPSAWHMHHAIEYSCLKRFNLLTPPTIPKFIITSSGAHYPERATAINLCNGVFTVGLFLDKPCPRK